MSKSKSKKDKQKKVLIWGGISAVALFLLLRKKDKPGNNNGTIQTGTLPRGLSNLNPMNIKISDVSWENKVPKSQNTDGTFEQFKNLKSGYLATLQNLDFYLRHNADTLRKVVYRWDRGFSGDYPTYYLDYVVEHSGLNPNDEIPGLYAWTDKAKAEQLFWKIILNMSTFENGHNWRANIQKTHSEFFIPAFNELWQRVH